MASESGTFGMDAPPAFIEALQNDFKTLSLETKKKYPQIKEVNNLEAKNDRVSFLGIVSVM